MSSQKDRLRLTDKLMGTGLIMELRTQNAAQLQAFKEASYKLLGRDTGWFHLCNTANCQMFEFWCAPAKRDLVIERCQLVAKRIGKELVIDLENQQAA